MRLAHSFAGEAPGHCTHAVHGALRPALTIMIVVLAIVAGGEESAESLPQRGCLCADEERVVPEFGRQLGPRARHRLAEHMPIAR